MILSTFFSITAKNKPYLQRIGITHVLNAAEGKKFGMVNTDRSYYRDTAIKYLGLQMLDLPSTDIAQFFFSAAAFIDDAVVTGGKINLYRKPIHIFKKKMSS